MISDDDLNAKIDVYMSEFKGDITDMFQVIGMLYSGRRYGWRVVRLVSSTKHYRMMIRYFGDVRELMPERGFYAHRSKGLALVDTLGRYWDYVKGRLHALPLEERRGVD